MKRNIPEIISKMTLSEKAGLCSGKDFWHTKDLPHLSVPSIMVSDGPHGLRKQDDKADHLGINDSIKAVCFPAACATAASFDEDLMQQLGDALGEECRAENVAVLLGPAVNIKRSPLCGRNFEYLSEDPYLIGKLASAQIRGVQKWDVGTSMKHFAANNQEYRRQSCSSDMDERTLREIYLSGFEQAVKEAQPWTLMCSYNRINGEYASENKKLLTDILREEWGFEGFVVSDWGAVNNRPKGLAAGLDLEMPDSAGHNDAKIVAAVQSGQLDEAVLDKAVARILNIVFRYADNARPEAAFDREKHHQLAAKFAKESAVLLKNDGTLPLSRDQKIAYIGAFAKHPRYQGGGSSHINASRVSSALESASNEVLYAEGFPGDRDETIDALVDEAIRAATQADVAVIFAGLPDSFESEGYDRAHMRLPDCQNQLIRQIAAVQKNTVVLLHNGSPIELPWAGEVNAILEMYLGGQAVGEAADALLYGDANPCGRLPETFPLKLSDTPAYLNFRGDGKHIRYAEGVYVGYRYYDAKEMEVLYPFGHGLSYTDFSYSNLTLSSLQMNEGETVVVSAQITNTGKYPGKEVVQLYIQDCTGTPSRPLKELKGFQKILLQPGETKSVSFTLDTRSLAWYSEELNDWYAACGRYKILLAHSSRDIRLQSELQYHTNRRLLVFVDADTPIGDMLDDDRTEPIIMRRVAKYFDTSQEGESDVGKEAVNSEMQRQMMENAPLHTLLNFAGVSDEELADIVTELNAALR